VKSAQSKRKAGKFFAALYAKFRFIEAQDDESAAGFSGFGIPVENIRVTGTLKAGADALADQPDRRAALEKSLVGRPVWLAASTHAEDEAAVFEAHRQVLGACPDTCLVLAPRVPDRAGEILQQARALGFKAAIIPDGPPVFSGVQVAIVDRIGMLGLWYRIAERCFIGGSLAPGGGHNPYEPARLECAITHGPHIWNFADDYAAFHAAGAARVVQNGEDLAGALCDPALTGMRGNAARVAQRGRRAVARTAERLVALL
jgi:3-deoxy-D-manno-octulosonic-acid transferase